MGIIGAQILHTLNQFIFQFNKYERRSGENILKSLDDLNFSPFSSFQLSYNPMVVLCSARFLPREHKISIHHQLSQSCSMSAPVTIHYASELSILLTTLVMNTLDLFQIPDASANKPSRSVIRIRFSLRFVSIITRNSSAKMFAAKFFTYRLHENQQ